MLKFLITLDGLVIVLICLVFWIGVAALVTYLLRRFIPESARSNAGSTAAWYIGTAGSIFAFLTAFLINSEYSTLKSAQSYVGQEVAAATQVATASSTLTPPDAERIQDTMTVYLNSLPTAEWNALKLGKPEISPSDRLLSDLQHQVYALSDSYPASTAALNAMSSGVEEMTQARRQWIVLASSTIPAPLLLLSIFGGIVLLVNALVLGTVHGRRYWLVSSGLVLMVALNIAVILAITAPFRGPFVTKSAPISQLVTEIQDGAFAPWIKDR